MPVLRSGAMSAATEPDSLEARLVSTVGPLIRHLLAHARRHPSWSGSLTYQQYNVLRMIDVEGPSAPAEVARRLMVSAPVVTRLATALARAGLLERQPDQTDRRSTRLALTAAGRDRVRAMRQDLLAAAGELLEPLPAERREAVAAALAELRVLLPGHEREATRRLEGAG